MARVDYLVCLSPSSSLPMMRNKVDGILNPTSIAGIAKAILFFLMNGWRFFSTDATFLGKFPIFVFVEAQDSILVYSIEDPSHSYSIMILRGIELKN